MKKVCILILIVLLSVLTYFLTIKNIKIGNWQTYSYTDIKALNDRLNQQIDLAKELSNQEYPESIAKIESANKKLKIAKEKYESKKQYIGEEVEIGKITIKQYKIERLWITLGDYAKKEGVELKLDLLETPTDNTYDLDVTVKGEYIGITDFIYDIEKDDTLGFKILNFKLLPKTTTDVGTAENEEGVQQITTSTTVDASELTATFKIEGVGIELN